nr:MAG TPA: hypothetical protein [Caudoviricetes sp.]
MKFCITKENPIPTGTGQHLIKFDFKWICSSSASGSILPLSSFA